MTWYENRPYIYAVSCKAQQQKRKTVFNLKFMFYDGAMIVIVSNEFVSAIS